MPTDAENLATAKTQIIARILEVSSSSQPDWEDQGRRVDAGSYLKILVEKLQDLNQAEQAITPGSVGAIWLGRKTYQERSY